MLASKSLLDRGAGAGAGGDNGGGGGAGSGRGSGASTRVMHCLRSLDTLTWLFLTPALYYGVPHS